MFNNKMPKDFTYDVVELIRCVKERPCIWDKSLESHKDRFERKTSWEEVFRILEPKYLEMSQTEKRITGNHILTKWTNMRDTFVKSMKTKFGKPKRKYMLYNQLKFLLKVIPNAIDHTENDEEPDDVSTEYHQNCTPMKYESNSENACVDNNTRKRRIRSLGDELIKRIAKKAAKKYENNDELNIVEVVTENENDPQIMNEDEAFFASLLPSVVRYTEDERLEFRIEVLAIMRRVKEKRKWIINP